MYIILSILLAIIGIIMICKPWWIYDITESWKHDGASDPSDFYILNIRIGGCIFAAVGIIGSIVLIIIP